MTTVYWILGFLVVWAILIGIASITLVKTGEVGVVFRFKKFVRVLQPGLGFVLPIIESVEHHSTQVHQHELPDEPERIDRISDVTPPGKKPPFRIIHRGKTNAIFWMRRDENNPSTDPADWEQKRFQELPDDIRTSMGEDSIDAPLTGEIAGIVEWYLEGTDRESIENFVQNVSPEEGRSREEEIRKRLEDMMARALQEFLGPVTLGHASERIPLFSRMLKERIEVLVGERPHPVTGERKKPWGIHIKDAYIKSVYAGRTVNTARSEAAAADSRKRDAIRVAEGVAAGTRLQADADAFAEQRKGEGEAARIGAMVAVMGTEEARFVATLDVAETVLPKANTIIMPSDLGAIGGILTLGREIARNNRKESDPADKK